MTTPWSLDVPLPTAKKSKWAAEIDNLINMPVGASIFFPLNQQSVHDNIISIVRYHHQGSIRGVFSTRVVTENSINGTRIWKLKPLPSQNTPSPAGPTTEPSTSNSPDPANQ